MRRSGGRHWWRCLLCDRSGTSPGSNRRNGAAATHAKTHAQNVDARGTLIVPLDAVVDRGVHSEAPA